MNLGMKNEAQKTQGRVNGFIPGSLRVFSNYLRFVSSGASSVASSVRSAGVSVASSIGDRQDHVSSDQVKWAAFDKLEHEGGWIGHVLLLAYRTGFQVWDVEEADNVREIASSYDDRVSFLQVQPKVLPHKEKQDKFSKVRPLLVIAADGTQDEFGGAHGHEIALNIQEAGADSSIPTSVRFYSLRSHSYVHVLKFRSAVYSIRCSPRVVAVAQAAQINCFDSATLEREYTILTNPLGPGYIGYGPLAVGTRWLAYSGSPILVSNAGRVSPYDLTDQSNLSIPPSNGKLVAHFAKESGKQLASGILNLGDMGYKKLSQYCSEFLPDSNNSQKTGFTSYRTNGTTEVISVDADNAGMVIVRDIVSKSVMTQFRAHRSPILALSFDPSGTLLVTASVHGHNINVFQIVPGSSTESDASVLSIHLYRLQRGLTNAVIQDISFSDDSRWIMISSSRGTSHLFSLDLTFSNNRSELGLAAKQTITVSPVSVPSKFKHANPNPSNLPITLSAVSRIRNGNNGWRSTVNGAAAAVIGRGSSLSNAIASSFHNCGGNDNFLDYNSLKQKYYLLVFSSSGCIIQYVLHFSTNDNLGTDLSGVQLASYEPTLLDDVKLVIEALRRWDVCQKRSRREQESNSDIYGDRGIGEHNKHFPKVVKKGTSIHPTRDGTVTKVRMNGIDERPHLYISEAELQPYQDRIPIWAKTELYFQVMSSDSITLENYINSGGEAEIEKIQTHVVEARSKSLKPVFDHHYAPKLQTSVVSPLVPTRKQKSSFPEDGKSMLACTSEDTPMAEFQNPSDINKCNDFRESSEVIKGFVNNMYSSKSEAHVETVNNKECVNIENRHEFVNNRMESLRVETNSEEDLSQLN